jgi:hypothetical protein
MATNHDHDEYDLLKNPAVDYDRSDLSARGILVFLAGLLVAGIFVEVVLGGMFHFLARSPFFAKGNPSPMVIEQKAPPLKAAGADFENAHNINPEIFPQPRLQTNDVRDMKDLLESEHEVLYPAQPFADQNGTVHLPINEAMKLVVERGLPVKPAGEVAAVAAKAPATPTAKVAPAAKEAPAQ